MVEREQIEDWRGRSGLVVTSFDDAMPGFLGLPRFFSFSFPEIFTLFPALTLTVRACVRAFMCEIGGPLYSLRLCGGDRIGTKKPWEMLL